MHQNSEQSLKDSIGRVISIIDACEKITTVDRVEKPQIDACKKQGLELMSAMRDATRLVGTLLEQTKAEKVTSKLNALTYFLDDMYRRVQTGEGGSLMTCLSIDDVQGARSVLGKLKKDANELQSLFGEVEGLF